MTVTVTTPGVGIVGTAASQSNRLSAALNVNKNPQVTAEAQEESLAVSISSDIQELYDSSSSASVRVQSVNAAVTATKLDTLDSGAAQVLRILTQLQSVASRATLPGLSSGERIVLDGQFQALRLSINDVPPAPKGSEFKVGALTSGLGVELPAEDSNAVVGGFSDTKLLDVKGAISLETPEAAAKATQSIEAAIANITNQREILARVQDAVEFATATINTAIENKDAAQSDVEQVGAPALDLAALLNQQPEKSVAVQTSRLPDDILRLLTQ